MFNSIQEAEDQRTRLKLEIVELSQGRLNKDLYGQLVQKKAEVRSISNWIQQQNRSTVDRSKQELIDMLQKAYIVLRRVQRIARLVEYEEQIIYEISNLLGEFRSERKQEIDGHFGRTVKEEEDQQKPNNRSS